VSDLQSQLSSCEADLEQERVITRGLEQSRDDALLQTLELQKSCTTLQAHLAAISVEKEKLADRLNSLEHDRTKTSDLIIELQDKLSMSELKILGLCDERERMEQVQRDTSLKLQDVDELDHGLRHLYSLIDNFEVQLGASLREQEASCDEVNNGNAICDTSSLTAMIKSLERRWAKITGSIGMVQAKYSENKADLIKCQDELDRALRRIETIEKTTLDSFKNIERLHLVAIREAQDKAWLSAQEQMQVKVTALEEENELMTTVENASFTEPRSTTATGSAPMERPACSRR
jgi:chromosome segregation ATPase